MSYLGDVHVRDGEENMFLRLPLCQKHNKQRKRDTNAEFIPNAACLHWWLVLINK